MPVEATHKQKLHIRCYKKSEVNFDFTFFNFNLPGCRLGLCCKRNFCSKVALMSLTTEINLQRNRKVGRQINCIYADVGCYKLKCRMEIALLSVLIKKKS